jgi:putative ABC transport system permease protein
MNVMLISVTERRKEIGIRRALGAQRTDIEAQFIIESVTLCFVGGIIGIILGIIISYVFSHFSKWEFLISQSAIILGFCVATAVGVFFGYYPARSASRLDPAAALRE